MKIAKIDEDPDISFVQYDVEVQGRHEHDMEPNFEFATAEKRVSTVEPVSTAGASVSTAGASSAKDKGKAKMEEAETIQTKTKLQLEQERLGYEESLRLQTKIDEEERQRIARVQEEASFFNIEECERVIPELTAGSSKRDAEEELVQESPKRLKTRERSKPKDKQEEELFTLKELGSTRRSSELMLVVKLLVEQDSEMSRELLRKIFMQVIVLSLFPELVELGVSLLTELADLGVCLLAELAVRIKSLLDAVRITAARVCVNAAQLDLVLLYCSRLRLLKDKLMLLRLIKLIVISDSSDDSNGPSIPRVPVYGPSVQGLLDNYGYDNIEDYLSDFYFPSTDKEDTIVHTGQDPIHECHSPKSKAKYVPVSQKHNPNVKSPTPIKGCVLGLPNVDTWDDILKNFGMRTPGRCADKWMNGKDYGKDNHHVFCIYSSDDSKGVSSKGPSITSIPKEGPSIARLSKEPIPKELLAWYGYDIVEDLPVAKKPILKVIFKSPTPIKGCVLGLANVETWDNIVKKFGMRTPGRCADKSKGKRKVKNERKKGKIRIDNKEAKRSKTDKKREKDKETRARQRNQPKPQPDQPDTVNSSQVKDRNKDATISEFPRYTSSKDEEEEEEEEKEDEEEQNKAEKREKKRDERKEKTSQKQRSKEASK
ncbi:hypothetical protein Tco_0776559 [Tanacetum coccineum]